MVLTNALFIALGHSMTNEIQEELVLSRSWEITFSLFFFQFSTILAKYLLTNAIEFID